LLRQWWCLRLTAITELGTFEITRCPIDFRDRAGSSFFREDGRESLAEWSIEAGVVSNNEIGRLDRGAQLVKIDHLAGDHFVRDASKTGDFQWDRNTRLLQSTIDANDIADIASLVEFECDRTDFDNLVVAMIEAGGLGIEDHAAQWKSRLRGRHGRTRLEPYQDTVPAGLLEVPHHVLFVPMPPENGVSLPANQSRSQALHRAKQTDRTAASFVSV